MDWLDVATSNRVSTKYAKYDMFNAKYLPKDTNKKYILDQTSLQPTFEMDSDSTVYQKQSDLLNMIKSKCLSSIEQEEALKELDRFRTPQKITVMMDPFHLKPSRIKQSTQCYFTGFF